MGIMQKNYAKYGEVFTVPVLHKKITFLIGPDVSLHFFKASDDEMSQKEVYEFNVPTFGRNVIYDVDYKERAEQFRFFSDALKAARLKSYVDMMVIEARDFFKEWKDEGVVDLFDEFSRLIILTASRTLMGREVREVMFEEVAKYYHDLDMGMLPISVIAPYLPIEAHRKRDAARIELSRIFSKIIQNRRAKNIREEDVIQAFIDARYKDGRALTDDQITGMLIAVLFAGQHTSSVTGTWTGYEMITAGPRVMGPIIEEQKRMMAKHGDRLDYDVLQEMDVLHRAIKEALRMHPPLILLLRYAREAFSVTTSKGEEFYIPKGHVVATSPTFQHTLPHLFEQPELYDPERYVRKEDQKKPATFIGFGYGRHQCMGEVFAYMQIKTIWSFLLRDFEFEMLDPVPPPNYDSMVITPQSGTRLKYRRKKLTV